MVVVGSLRECLTYEFKECLISEIVELSKMMRVRVTVQKRNLTERQTDGQGLFYLRSGEIIPTVSV